MATPLKIVKRSEQLQHHRELLHASGISDEVANARGYRSVESVTELIDLGFADFQCRVPALVIPIHDVNGNVPLYQIRPDLPRIDRRTNKPIKYETPRGSDIVLDVPPTARGWLHDTDRDLWITEGSRKADAAVTCGLCCISFLGVSSFTRNREPLPDWHEIELRKRCVYVCYDSDVMQKPDVSRALTKLKSFLESHGANVWLVYLPQLETGKKQGLDDYLGSGRSVEELESLATQELREFHGDTAPDSTKFSKPTQLMNFDFKNDPGCLIGDRWLCQGRAALLYAPTGKGKSSLESQAADTWALARPFFGMKPTRPLKSLIIQAENDFGDLAEAQQGIASGLCLSSTERGTLDRMVRFYTESAVRGDSFITLLDNILNSWTPDLIWLDPLLHFCKGSLVDQELVSNFCRAKLTPLMEKYRCAAIVVHHTGKPQQRKRGASGKDDPDYGYFGSVELANWARAILSLREDGPGVFKFIAGKRGQRAGLTETDDDAAPVVREISIAHSTTEIFWRRDTHSLQISKMDAGLLKCLSAMKRDVDYTETALRDLVMKTFAVGKSAALDKTGKCHAGNVRLELVERCKTEAEGVFRRPAPDPARAIKRVKP